MYSSTPEPEALTLERVLGDVDKWLRNTSNTIDNENAVIVETVRKFNSAPLYYELVSSWFELILLVVVPSCNMSLMQMYSTEKLRHGN